MENTVTQYVFRVRYQNGQERNIQSQVPFEQWRVRSGIPASRKAELIGDERKIEAECAAPPAGIRL